MSTTGHLEVPAPALPPAAGDPPTSGQGEVSHIGTAAAVAKSAEIGGRGGLDPTRFGDWEKGGRCIDF